MTPRITAVILAAGFGKRMHSSLPKVLHRLCGAPLLEYSIRAAEAVTTEKPVVIVGHGADSVRATFGERVDYAFQAEQLGTAHALMQAESLLRDKTDQVLLIYGDMPLLTGETLQRVIDLQRNNAGPVSLLSVILPDPHGFGRILRGTDGSVEAIIEEAQTTPETYNIKELNTGIYCFDSEWLWDALRKIEKSPKGEYYLTDIVEVARKEGKNVRAEAVTDAQEALGINNREHLAESAQVMQQRINRRWLQSGVTMVSPQTTTIDLDVEIEPDTILYPGCSLLGRTRVRSGCILGPNVFLQDCLIDKNVQASNIEAYRCKVFEGKQLSAFTVYVGQEL